MKSTQNRFISKCLVVYKEEYPWDVRVEKILDSLATAGYEVTLLCRNTDQAPRVEFTGGINIRRLPLFRWAPAFLRRILNFSLWLNPVWLISLHKLARSIKPDVILIRDLPLVLAGVAVGRIVRASVVFDMAECYPEMYRSSRRFRDRWWRVNLLKDPRAASIYERLAVSAADQILVMVEESRDRLVNLGVSPEKISIVSNTPPSRKIPKEARRHTGTEIRLVYVGFVTRLRGLDTLVRAIHHFVEGFGDEARLQCDVVGRGAAQTELKQLVSKLGLNEHVKIHGWLDSTEVSKLVANANVGVLTYRVCSHWNHTIPNKIFDYMAEGLPVLATDVVPIKRLIDKYDCGVVADYLSPRDIAGKLELLRDAEVRQRMGDRGHAAVKAHLTWEQDAERLLGVVDKLCRGSDAILANRR